MNLCRLDGVLMWRIVVTIVLAALCCPRVKAQESEVLTAILEFTGYGAAEEIDAEEMERFERMMSHPVRINHSDQTRLNECGLFTRYQTASLLDYRIRHGDVLSFTELSAVDGFGQEFVRKLRPFISLESGRPAGQRPDTSRYFSHELELKAGITSPGSVKGAYGVRYKMEDHRSLQVSLAISKSSGASRPDDFTGNVIWNLPRSQTRFIIGSFNARFGQGLALWNGMSISGINKPSTFLKRASSLSGSSSFTGNYAYKGGAVETLFKRFRLTALSAVTDIKDGFGLMPAANLSWLLPSGQLGLTHYADVRTASGGVRIPDMKSSFDMAFTVKGTDLFGEITYDWVSSATAALAGTVFPAGENMRLAAMIRYYPSTFNPANSAALRSLTSCMNEYGSSLSAEFKSGKWLDISGAEGFGTSVRRFDGSVSLDAACFPQSKSDNALYSAQMKALAEFKWMLTGAFAVKIRVSERIRSWGLPYRTDCRLDLFYYSRFIDASLRINALKCDGYGILSYAEGQFKYGAFKTCLRIGGFCIDDWDDRIYAYERDVPGSYNVPAFYGRGFWTALTGSLRLARWGRVYLRTAFTGYPFVEKKKPGKAELKLMLKIKL